MPISVDSTVDRSFKFVLSLVCPIFLLFTIVAFFLLFIVVALFLLIISFFLHSSCRSSTAFKMFIFSYCNFLV